MSHQYHNNAIFPRSQHSPPRPSALAGRFRRAAGARAAPQTYTPFVGACNTAVRKRRRSARADARWARGMGAVAEASRAACATFPCEEFIDRGRAGREDGACRQFCVNCGGLRRRMGFSWARRSGDPSRRSVAAAGRGDCGFPSVRPGTWRTRQGVRPLHASARGAPAMGGGSPSPQGLSEVTSEQS